MIRKIAIQGICFDKKSSYLKGPADAPPLIRKCFHSAASNYFSVNGKDLSDLLENDVGDWKEIEYFEIEDLTRKHLDVGYSLITLGGDHSITFPILKAYAKIYSPLQILQIDAHDDLYPIYQNDPYSHACPFARIMENKLAVQLTQVGIRSLANHVPAQLEKYPILQYRMDSFNLKDINIDPSIPLYLRMDMDAIDPAFAPGVSHPEPAGLTTREVIQLIQQIGAPIVGADIVEYNPHRDIHEMTGLCAAKILKEIGAKMSNNEG